MDKRIIILNNNINFNQLCNENNIKFNSIERFDLNNNIYKLLCKIIFKRFKIVSSQLQKILKCSNAINNNSDVYNLEIYSNILQTFCDLYKIEINLVDIISNKFIKFKSNNNYNLKNQDIINIALINVYDENLNEFILLKDIPKPEIHTKVCICI